MGLARRNPSKLKLETPVLEISAGVIYFYVSVSYPSPWRVSQALRAGTVCIELTVYAAVLGTWQVGFQYVSVD